MKHANDGFWALLTCITLLISCVIYDYAGNPKNTHSKVIGVTCMTLNNPFYEVINNELRKQTEANHDQLLILDPQLDAQKQGEQIEQMVEKRVDAIILNPVDSSALEAPLKKAKEADIPVIVIDSPVQHEELIDTTIVSDNYEAGKLAARAMMHDLDSAQILLLEHTQADSGRDRILGFLSEIKNHPEYQVVDRKECLGQLEKAMPAAADALEAHPQINVVMALNDPSALGAAAAAESMGRDDLFVYGVDGTPDFKSKMDENKVLHATVAQSPYTIARKAAKSAYDLMDGKSVESFQLVDVALITPDNLDSYSRENWQ